MTLPSTLWPAETMAINTAGPCKCRAYNLLYQSVRLRKIPSWSTFRCTAAYLKVGHPQTFTLKQQKSSAMMHLLPEIKN